MPYSSARSEIVSLAARLFWLTPITPISRFFFTTPHARVARPRRKKSVPLTGRSCSSLNFSTAASSGRQSSIS